MDELETLAQLLVAEGFSELEEVAYVALEEIAGIEGLDDELAEELQSRAVEALERKEEAARAERRELGVEDALAELPHLTEAMMGAFFILDDPIFNGLAIALIFGILVSTLLTLVVIPLLYFVYLQRID